MNQHLLILAASRVVVAHSSTFSWVLVAAVAIGTAGALLTTLSMLRALRARDKAEAAAHQALEASWHPLTDLNSSGVHLEARLGERTVDLGDLSSADVRANVEGLLKEAELRAKAEGEKEGEGGA